MRLIRNFTFILLSLCILSFAETEYAEPKPSFDNPRKIVFSITEDTPHAIDHILSVASNVVKYYGVDNVQMKIVAYSKGIALLLKSHGIEEAKRVDALMQYEVEFIACGNTMKTYEIQESELIEGSEVVTAGVVELLESVKKGWTYIKP